MDIRTWTQNFWIKNETDCLNYLQKEWNTVPLLNANDTELFKNGSLVRFRGMIQDMYNPEYYYEKYEVVNELTKDYELRSGKYKDITDCKNSEIFDFDSKRNVVCERSTFVVITVPGLNKWVEKIEYEKFRIHNYPDVPSSSASKQIKRNLDEIEEMETDSVIPNEPGLKKQCSEVNKTPVKQYFVSKEHILNFPIPCRNGKACHVKIYEKAEGVKINDLIEFVGFLSVDPLLSQGSQDEDENNELEHQTHHPPSSLIPRIHCVSWKKMQHNNILINEAEPKELGEEKMKFLKNELHLILTQLLFGDSFAAEYLIYHLISSIYLRKDLLALGKFTLNFSNIPASKIPDYGEKLYKLLETLLSKSHYVPMTLENMNELAFTPKKDYDCDRLTSGILQLSNNTHLILNETRMETGKLNASGVRSITALSNVIKNQKAMYDFNYYQMEFDCDIPILILSEGKSLLPSDCHVPLILDEICSNTFDEIIEAAQKFLKPELLNEIRIYLTSAQYCKYDITDNIQELIQNDFVMLRQEENISAEDLHHLLVLGRLICISEGKSTLNEDCWKKALALETERKQRLK